LLTGISCRAWYGPRFTSYSLARSDSSWRSTKTLSAESLVMPIASATASVTNFLFILALEKEAGLKRVLEPRGVCFFGVGLRFGRKNAVA
jgi:hypothetical protein